MECQNPNKGKWEQATFCALKKDIRNSFLFCFVVLVCLLSMSDALDLASTAAEFPYMRFPLGLAYCALLLVMYNYTLTLSPMLVLMYKRSMGEPMTPHESIPVLIEAGQQLLKYTYKGMLFSMFLLLMAFMFGPDNVWAISMSMLGTDGMVTFWVVSFVMAVYVLTQGILFKGAYYAETQSNYTSLK